MLAGTIGFGFCLFDFFGCGDQSHEQYTQAKGTSTIRRNDSQLNQFDFMGQITGMATFFGEND